MERASTTAGGVGASRRSALGPEVGLVRDAGSVPDALWVGGGSGAGKSTVAARLAERHGLRRYDVVEGFRLLPRLVAPLLGAGSAGVWLLPTPRFREVAFARRGTTGSTTGTTSDRPRALANLLERDALFTGVLRAEVGRLGLAGVEVDVGDGEDDVLARVEAALDL